jgi:hypothetical protein
MSEPIRVTSHVSRDFLQNSAYFNTVPKVVWEYVSNSVDNPKPNVPVDVEVRISKERVIVVDDGCGMSRDDLRNFFQMHAENIRRGRGERVRGRYGTGKCAAFGIADVLRIETSKDGLLNVVELSRKDIERARSGEAFPVKDIMVDRATTQEDGTRIIISGLNTKNIELLATRAYVERHLGRQLQNHHVVINDHVCEYQEPNSSWHQVFHPTPDVAKRIGSLELLIKVSPIPLDKERSGVDVLSNGIWHDTTHGTLDGDISRRIFGEVDMPALEEKYDTEKVPPFDNTRNMTLNQQNPLVASLLGWIDECLHEVARELSRQERERKTSEEAKRLARQAQQLADLLNDDFSSLQIELDKIRRVEKLRKVGLVQDVVPDEGEMQTAYQMGGSEHGAGTRGEQAGPGEEKRPGPSLLEGKAMGSPGKVSEQRQRRSTFHVEYKHEEEKSPRSHYEGETRTIAINLDHPQIVRAYREGGGIEGKQFREITYEVACIEYAIALGHEQLSRDEFYGANDLLFDIRNTINRVSRAI